MLISHMELVNLVKTGVITADLSNVNGASIDITLSDTILVEDEHGGVVNLKNKGVINTRKQVIGKKGYAMYPGDFILASTVEIFNLPNDIACEYKLKSSLARSGLQHALAGWCDPSWHNSRLTMELTNTTRHHTLMLHKGMKIGQMMFFKCQPVPEEHSYAVKGQYNHQLEVTASKGVR